MDGLNVGDACANAHVVAVKHLEQGRSVSVTSRLIQPAAAAVSAVYFLPLLVAPKNITYSCDTRHAYFLDQTALKPKVRLETMALMNPLQLKLSSAAEAMATPACTVAAIRPFEMHASSSRIFRYVIASSRHSHHSSTDAYSISD